MIKSYKCKKTRLLAEGSVPPAFRAFALQAEKRLRRLEAAVELEDLRNPPSNCFEALKGDRKGQYSVRINLQWRVCFTWVDGAACDVEIVDYH